MSSLKLYELPTIERMRQALSECKGNVFVKLPDERDYLLNKDGVLVSILSMFENQKVSMKLEYDNPSDAASLIGMLF
ncbi:MAG: hypothetical protein IK078_06775 [Lachnospiraceae bacterium]|nr:hypothetical protein [Lachnospiraceae bacterium]